MPYTQDGLPWSGDTVITRHTSYKAAVAAQAGRGAKTARYLAWLAEHGPATDHEAAVGLGFPLSSVTSIRNGVKRRICCTGIAVGPYGRHVALFMVVD